MDAPVRAFLMLRADDGEWKVTVCRDLGTVLRTWKARKQPDWDVAVLHVGFDRPPSRLFDEIADAHPGQMLLTTAGKYALPSSFIASAEPVSITEGTEVFIGLQGWGYSLEDPTVQVDLPDASRTAKDSQREPQGWVASFLLESPSSAETFLSIGIYDDATYLEGEAELERNVRHHSGVFRTHHLVGINYDDPCELARAVPPWLAERDLSTLGLPVRANNVFRVSEIKTVRDLADWSSEALLKQKHFGRKSLKDTLQALNAVLNKGPLQTATAGDNNESSQLLTEIRRSLLSFSHRERDILVRRLGFETIPETLQQVADDYNVTRERIRQIEAHATAKWIRKSYWDDILEQKITRLLIGRSFPLPVAGVEAIDPWFKGVFSHLDFFRNLVRAVCKDRIHFVDIEGIYYFSLMDQEYWIRLVSEAEALLSSGAGQEWSENYAYSLVQSLLPDTSREFGQLLWDKSSRFCHFSAGLDGSRVFTSYGRGADQLVEAILAESDTPLHYTKIAERANLKQGKNLDPRRAHSAAANVGLLFARGTYGLARHVPLSDERMLQVRMEAEEIICSDGSGRQWHTSEILSELSESLNDGFQGLDKYVLDIALSKSEMLKPLGKMTWAEVGQETDDGTRIGIHQAVISLVKAAGHPLRTKEIKDRLTAVRGIGEFLQISPIDPLIRLEPGVWGINERDVPLLREEQQGLVEELVRILEVAQSGIHASEICDVLPLRDCPLDAFLSIAIQDRRLNKAVGEYVYLTNWGSPRRETIGHAVSTVLKKACKPLLLNEIRDLVERRVGRKCERLVISRALQAFEAEFDELTREWSLNILAIDDDEEDASRVDIRQEDQLGRAVPSRSLKMRQ